MYIYIERERSAHPIRRYIDTHVHEGASMSRSIRIHVTPTYSTELCPTSGLLDPPTLLPSYPSAPLSYSPSFLTSLLLSYSPTPQLAYPTTRLLYYSTTLPLY